MPVWPWGAIETLGKVAALVASDGLPVAQSCRHSRGKVQAVLEPNKVRQILKEKAEFKGAAATFASSKANKAVYPPNPWLTLNGHDGDSPLTARNLNRRAWKGRASKVFDTAGSVGANMGSVVNTTKIARHGVALASTIAHTARLDAMSRKVKDGGSLRAMLNAVMIMKGVKGVHRVGHLALTAIPDIGMAGSIAGGVLTVARKLQLKVTEISDLELALRLHWQAYRELKLLGGRAGTGPALSLVHELTTKGVTGRFDFGDLHSVEMNNRIMLEPAGYAVILFKLTQD